MNSFFSSEQKQAMFWCGIGLIFIALLILLGPVLTPFIAGAIFAYMLNPGVDWMDGRKIRIRKLHIGMPRGLAVFLMMLLLLLALLIFPLIVVPMLSEKIPQIQDRLPAFLQQLDATIAPRLRSLGVNIHLNSTGIKKFLTDYFTSHSDAREWLFSWARIGGMTLIGWIGTIMLTSIVIFYLLIDWHLIVPKLKQAFPTRWRAKTVKFTHEVDLLLSKYLRAQLLVMLILALYYSIALTIAGFDVALPIGILTGLLIFIPYLGFGIGLLLAILAALLQVDSTYSLIAVAIIYSVGQALESFFLTPRLVGERIGLHPLVVIFALLAFGNLFGFVGVLLALPASAILLVALRHLRSYYMQSSFYHQQ